MTKIENDLYKQMLNTALNADLPVLSVDKCCRLLAYVYVYGGGNEQVVYQDKLREDIFYAWKRSKIEGGETPDPEVLPILQDYIKSLPNMAVSSETEFNKVSADFKNPPQWVLDLESEYKIKGYR